MAASQSPTANTNRPPLPALVAAILIADTFCLKSRQIQATGAVCHNGDGMLGAICWDPMMPDALQLLRTRRSLKPVELHEPGPSAAEIETLLTVASRVPDHGKLTPWRFIVFEGEARFKAGAAIEAAFRIKYPDAKPEQIE